MNDNTIILPEIADNEDKSSPLGNCIRNTYRHLKKWAKRTRTDCFRIYDRELALYPLAIDLYAGRFCVHYFSRGKDNEEPSEDLIQETEQTLKALFSVSSERIYWRTRIKSKKTRQYEKADRSNDYFTATEYGIKFKINLRDYLDTGLFLDHREARRIVASLCDGKRVLNLFAYTCSFSVHAAAAGAVFTKSVDMSNTYTAWGRDNFLLNNIQSKHHPIIRADCLKFINQELHTGEKYDIIIIDPPTISRSKKMDGMFDVQTDYIYLISKTLHLLTARGIIFFSTNSRKFVFDESLFHSCSIAEISHKTKPIDFRDQKIHRCWQIQKTIDP